MSTQSQKNAKRLPPKELAQRLGRDMEALERFFKYRREIMEEVRGYEAKYGIRSEDLQVALNEDRIRETNEIVDWIFAYHSLQDMNQEWDGA